MRRCRFGGSWHIDELASGADGSDGALHIQQDANDNVMALVGEVSPVWADGRALVLTGGLGWQDR